MKKENPGAFDETAMQRSCDAAELGVLLGDRTEKTTDRLIEFIKRRSELSQNEWRTLVKALHNKPAR